MQGQCKVGSTICWRKNVRDAVRERESEKRRVLRPCNQSGSWQEKAAKWRMQDGQMDGLTTNGILVMHPRHGFSQDSRPGLWREISVCGNVFTLRETRSSQQRGRTVGDANKSVTF